MTEDNFQLKLRNFEYFIEIHRSLTSISTKVTKVKKYLGIPIGIFQGKIHLLFQKELPMNFLIIVINM